MANMKELLTWYVQGKIKVVIDERFSLENAVDAINKVTDRKVKGKVVITP
jgi:NADPH2:quinone reductase